MRERVMGTASSTADTASHIASDAVGAVGQAPEATRRQVEGNPLAAGVLAFAAGLVVAALVPESESERAIAERVQPQVEQVASEVGEAASESVQHLRPAAQDAAEHLKDRAQQSVSTVAADVKDQVSERMGDGGEGDRGFAPGAR